MKSPKYRTRNLAVLALAGLVVALVLQSHDRNLPGSKDEHPPPNQRTVGNVADLKLPLSFEANRGQTDSQVKFLSRGNGYNLFLTATEAVIRDPHSAVLRMKLVNANPASEIEGLDELPGKSNYFIGSDPQQWRASVTNYAKVKYREVYPGVDLVYYGHERQLEYDFILSPGADPKQIKLAFDGAERMRIDGDGNLALGTTAGEARQYRPVIYQEVNGDRRTVDGRYVLLGQNEVGFEIGEYDAGRPLVIDPVLSYATYLGGSANDFTRAIRVDAAGAIYVAGNTLSTDFPVVNALQAAHGGSSSANGGDVIVAKFNPAGALVYSTYLGGSSDDGANAMTIDATGAVYLAGVTFSTNYPLLNPLQSTLRGPFDACVTKLNTAGNALVYSTYLGGSDREGISGIAVDEAGAAYVTGGTSSADFPLVNALQSNLGGGPHPADVFVTRINPAGSAIVYSTFLGGSQSDNSAGIAVDAAGNVYVAGTTRSTNFPLANALQPNFAGISDTFIVKINPAGSALVYSTYLGGSGDEAGFRIAVDQNGAAYVTGTTNSTNFPTANAFQSNSGGNLDVFVAKLNPSGNAFVYSTYLGGIGGDVGLSVATDGAGNAYVGGTAFSPNFPLARSLQSALRGPSDAFITKLNDSGRIAWSTLLGGSGGAVEENVYEVVVDAVGNVYAAGITISSDFPVTPGAAQNSLKGAIDGFIVKLGADVATVSAASFSGATLAAESIVAAFGAGLATTTSAATTIPLPTQLAGTQVSIKDSAGAERLAPLFFVAPNQANCLIPAGTAQGTAAVTISTGDGSISTGIIQIAAVAPGLFAANANGQGVPAAGFLRFAANGTQTAEGPVFRFDAATNRFVPAPIDLGPAGEQTFLILYGTGFRNRSALSAVACQIGGETSEVQFAGPQGGLVGLDQANVRIPRSLAGRGEVDVVMTVDGKAANTVRVNIR
jgi:uncharacterized protein (TIGR03437 family)